MPRFKSIEKNVLDLEAKERLSLLLRLLKSLESDVEQEDQTDAWVKEADSRYIAWKSGKMKTYSKKEVFRDLRHKPEDDR